MFSELNDQRRVWHEPGAIYYSFRCPGCNEVGFIDESQLVGEAGIYCGTCGWQGEQDWRNELLATETQH